MLKGACPWVNEQKTGAFASAIRPRWESIGLEALGPSTVFDYVQVNEIINGTYHVNGKGIICK